MTVVKQVPPDSVSFVLRNLVHDEEEPGDFDASLGRTRTGSVQDDALPKTMACLSSNVDINVAWSSRMWLFRNPPPVASPSIEEKTRNGI